MVATHGTLIGENAQDITDLNASQLAQDTSIVSIISTVTDLVTSSATNAANISTLEASQLAQDTAIQTVSQSVVSLSQEVDTVADTVSGLVNNISPRIIGIAHFPGTSSPNNFRHINQYGNFLVGFKYYTSPIYQEKMRDVVIGSDHMKEIDTLYIKTTTSGPVGTDSEGKRCWWISPDPLPGYRPMLAFKRDGVIKPHVYLGRYMGFYSEPEEQPTTGYNKSTYQSSLASSKNIGGATGFRMMDIYDMALLRTLILVFGGNADVQTAWGDNTGNVVKPDNGATGAKALGIYDLWRSFHYQIDKITVNSSRKLVMENPFNGATINTNLDIPYSTATRFISEMAAGQLPIGDDTHDYLELFIPSEFVTDIRDSAYQDGVRFTSSNTSVKDVYAGGSPRDSGTDYISPGGITDNTRNFSGIFMWAVEHNVNHTNTHSSMRLAKS